MLVVSNTSPILNLSIIDRLDLLKDQFEKVVVPKGVIEELQLDREIPGVKQIRTALEDGWLTVIEVENDNLVKALRLELDKGESEAIALALQLGVKQILMDERAGRAKANAMGLSPVGVLGVLLRAKLDGHLSSMKDTMMALQQQAGFRIGDKLFRAMLKESGEQE